MSYRVFISYKHTAADGKSVTRDYYIAADLHRTLTQAGIPTFFSEKDLSTGDFTNEINKALKEADILVLIGTKPEHITSQWVTDEWSSFLVAINSGRKPKGDIYTYLEGMTINQLPMMLGKRQSYTTLEKAALVQRIMIQLGRNPRDFQGSMIQPKSALLPIIKAYSPLIVLAIAVVVFVSIITGIVAASLSNSIIDSTTSTTTSTTTSATTRNDSSLSGIGSVSVGDHIFLGNYKQGANGEVKPIEWRVLAVEDGKALLISERLLDCVKYNNTRQSVTWETCTLRKWMNNDFLNKAFTESEQARIATVTNTNSNNPEYNTTGGESTDDKIFALSFDEAEMYFKSDDDRLAAPTGYAKKRGAWANESHTLDNGGNPGWWWLRSPGHGGSLAVFVRSKGDISTYGTDVINSPGSVRPAMWLIL